MEPISVRKIFVKTRNALWADWKLYVAVFVYTFVLSLITILKNYTFLTSGFDLGVYNQAFWTTLYEGKFFYITGDLSFNPLGSFFGTHFSPVLFLILPFYAIYPHIQTLQIIQSAVLALGALPIYWMAREKWAKNTAFFISTIYLVYPPLLYLNLGDFHVEAFTSTFFLFALYYFEREKWVPFLVFTVLAMSTIEFAPIIAVFVVIYGLVLYIKGRFKDRKKASIYMALTIFVATLWFILALQVKAFFNPYTMVIPSAWHNVAATPTSIFPGVFENFSSKVFYLMAFLGVVAFIPIIAPGPLIMIIPWVAASFVSQLSLHHWIYAQYNGFVIPFVFISLVYSIERLTHGGPNPKQVKRVLVVLYFSTIIFGAYLTVAPGSPWMYQLPVPNERTELMNRVLALIPPDASILTQNDIFPHVSSRSNAYMYIPVSGPSNVSVDYVLIDAHSTWANWSSSSIGEKISPLTFASKALSEGSYGIVASAKGILLLKRNYNGEPKIFVPFAEEYNFRSLRIGHGQIIQDDTATYGQVMYHATTDPDSVLAYGPYVRLLPGLYRATYIVKIGAGFDKSDDVLEVDVTASSGKVLLAKDYLYGKDLLSENQWFNISLTYGLDQIAENVEFRLSAYGNHDTYLDSVSVKQLSPEPVQAGQFAFNYRDLTVGKGTVYNGAIFHTGQAGTLWYGPYANLPQGNFTVLFSLRQDKAYSGSLIDLDVAVDGGKEILAKMTSYSSNFTEIGQWQAFELKFSLPNNTRVEFRGSNVREGAPVSLLVITAKFEVE